MQITSVQVKKFGMENQNRLKAMATVVFEDSFAVHDLRVIEGRKGLFVAMPSRKLPDGKFKDIAHPINQATRDQIENAVLEEYNNQE